MDETSLSAHSSSGSLLVQIVAILAAFSFVLAYVIVPRYVSSTLGRPRLLIAAWGDEEFLIATAMTLGGLVSCLIWDSILPEIQDSLVLGPLPVPMHISVLARLAATISMIAILEVALNAFTGLCFPLLTVPAGGGLIRSLGAYWLVVTAAGAFAFSVVLGVQGVAAVLLPYRLFRRCSAYLQLSLVAGLLALYFLTPPLATVHGLTAPGNELRVDCIPSFWFLGLFQELNGPVEPIFLPLALRAVWAMAAAMAVAAAAYPCAYRTVHRRIIEQPHVQPIKHSGIGDSFIRFLTRKLFTRALDRTVCRFVLRGLLRSRQHRLVMGVYGGIGIAVSLAYSKSVLQGISQGSWNQPNPAVLSASFVFLVLTIIGVRAVFALPICLPANWIFRVTAFYPPARYSSAVRRSLFATVVFPFWCATGIVFLAIWPTAAALGHLVVLLVIGYMLVELALYGYRSIPFACSYLPGSANVKTRLGVLLLLTLTITAVLSGVEYWALNKPARYFSLLAILVTAAVWAARRRRAFAQSPYNRLQFERLPEAEIFALDLSPGSALFEDDAYVGAVEHELSLSLWRRMRPVLLVLTVLLIAGFVYEKAGEWRDRKNFPQLGRSFDVGGRSLNLNCSGAGTPTVILESNWGAPGFTWVYIQRKIATFTRVCWYDRAGYGWSAPGPFPYHSDAAARDLHKLLTVSGTRSPFVLVGHSMGAFNIRVFRGYYPTEVAGLVFVDPMSEDLTKNIHNHIEFFRPAVLFAHRVLGLLGFFRLLSSEPGVAPNGSGLTSKEWATIAMLRWQPKSLVATGKEPPLWINGEMARASGSFGNLPVIVLTAGIADQEEDPKLDADHDLKIKLHAELASLSTQGRQIIVNSGHQIPTTAPWAVINAVQEMVTQLRRTRNIR